MVATISSVEFFLRDESEEISPTLEFNQLSSSEEESLFKNLKGMDLDYLLLVERCEVLLNIPEVLEYIRPHSGKFRRGPEYQNLYSSTFKGAWVLGQLGHLLIGVPIEGLLSADKKEEDLLKTSLAKNLKTKMNCLHFNPMPNQEFVSVFLETFQCFNVVIFSYGQKQPIESIGSTITNLAGKCKMELAFAAEYFLPGLFVSCMHDVNLGKYSFSNFHSNVSVNYRINNPVISANIVRGSYRTVCYNSFQHLKKHTEFILKRSNISNTPNVGFNVLLYKLYSFFKGALANISKLKEGIRENRLRMEAYFVISKEAQIETSLRSISKAFKKFKYCYCSNTEIERFLHQYPLMILRLLDECHRNLSIETVGIFAMVYDKFVSAVYSLSSNTPRFRSDNFGVGIQRKFYSSEGKTFNEEFWNSNDPLKIWKSFDHLFSECNTLLEIRLAFFQSFYPSSLQSINFAKITIFYISKILLYIKKKSSFDALKYSESIEIEYVTIENWIEICQTKRKSNVFVSIVFDAVESWKNTCTDSYDILIEGLADEELYIYSGRKLYVYKKCNVTIETKLNIENMQELVSKYSFDVVFSLIEGTISAESQEHIQIIYLLDTLREKIQQDFDKIAEDYKMHMEFDMDNDFFLRCLYAYLPSNIDFCPSHYFSILSLCKKFKDFVKLVAIFVVSSLNPRSTNDRFKKFRENFRYSFIQIGDFKKLTTFQVMFYTGAFQYANCANVINNQMQTSLKKAPLEVFLPIEKRYTLLKCPTISRQTYRQRMQDALELNAYLETVNFEDDIQIPEYEVEESDSSAEGESLNTFLPTNFNHRDSIEPLENETMNDAVENPLRIRFSFIPQNPMQNPTLAASTSQEMNETQNISESATSEHFEESMDGDFDSNGSGSFNDETASGNLGHANMLQFAEANVGSHSIRANGINGNHRFCSNFFMEKIRNHAILAGFADDIEKLELTFDLIEGMTNAELSTSIIKYLRFTPSDSKIAANLILRIKNQI